MRVDQGFVADPSEVLLDIRGAKPPCMDSSRGSGWRPWLGSPPRNALQACRAFRRRVAQTAEPSEPHVKSSGDCHEAAT